MIEKVSHIFYPSTFNHVTAQENFVVAVWCKFYLFGRIFFFQINETHTKPLPQPKLFNDKSSLYILNIYDLVGLYGISTIVGNLIQNTVLYIYIYIYIVFFGPVKPELGVIPSG